MSNDPSSFLVFVSGMNLSGCILYGMDIKLGISALGPGTCSTWSVLLA
jgi:hypothetical protein